MENEISILEENSIRSKIHVIRGQQVMLDFDLAQIYGYETKNFNRQVKNNIERFDSDFMFQLSDMEVEELSRCKIFTLNKGRGSNIKYAPYAFTEQESDLHHKETDKKIKELFSLMDKYNIKETQGIFFQGQIFDAYAKFESFLSAAKKEIILIDNYVDLSILQRLAKKKKGVNVTIYTDPKTKLTAQDIQTFNAQYPTLIVNHTTKSHDRFLIIDNSTIYHIGASLKDLGKKCFGFTVFDPGFIPMILKNL